MPYLGGDAASGWRMIMALWNRRAERGAAIMVIRNEPRRRSHSSAHLEMKYLEIQRSEATAPKRRVASRRPANKRRTSALAHRRNRRRYLSSTVARHVLCAHGSAAAGVVCTRSHPVSDGGVAGDICRRGASGLVCIANRAWHRSVDHI